MHAQKKVSISGEIKDKNDIPVPQALIAIEGTTTGAYTDDNGYYSLAVLPGKHTISVSAFGFKPQKVLIDVKSNAQQNFTLEEQMVNLAPVEVYGKTKSQRLRESSFTVNAVDVKASASFLHNLNSLMGRSSGIKIREDGGVGADFDLSINGLSGNSVRHFIDGVPLSSLGSDVSLSNIPTNLIDYVEIYKGAVPAYLGADALGGAINIITKKNQRNYLDVSYGIGSFDTHKADLNAQFIEPKTKLIIRPAIGVNYSENDYMMKGVEIWDEDSRKYIPSNRKRFHDDYFSLLGQIEIGFANKPWA
ncbi:MAG: carboxypeptidase-like regulatory domain-containing protein, partial [Clostridiales bacterium]|nr:carboxypeptidase-like regulatory domain-containing protein [Clostridiales bacterium]